MQLVPTVEHHYWSLIRRFVGAVSFVELKDGAIHGGLTLARCVDGFLGQSQYFIHPRLHDQEFLIQIVSKSSLEHLSGLGALPGFRQYSTYFALS